MSKVEEATSPTTAGSGSRFVLYFLMLLLCYPLSPAPVALMIRVSGASEFSGVESAFNTFYAPLGYLIENNEWVEPFYEWQSEMLNSLFYK